MRRGFLLTAALLSGLGRPAAGQDPAALERALGAELKRAVSGLKAEGYSLPYYVGLTATDVEASELKCSMGYPTFESRYRQRLLTPDLRVGDYSLDNHPISTPGGFVGRGLSFEDDEFALRHGIWRVLDGAYKEASAEFLRKQALRVSRGKTEYDTDDLSREEPRVRPAPEPAAAFSSESLGGLCMGASRVFRGVPGLLSAEVGVRSRRQWSRLRDSEGSRVDFGRDTVEVELEAVDISSDGMRLYATRRFAAVSPAGLPSEGEIKAQSQEMLADLKALKLAQSTSPFSAPALVDPSVSAAIVLSIGMRLSGEEQRNPSGAQTFRDKMGKPVLPADFSLEDDPTAASFGGVRLIGRYDFDDQGLPPKKAVLIDKGVLKGLLLSRYPVIGFPHSNGHGRGFPGYWPEGAPGNLFLRASRALPEDQLLRLLREECRRRNKPYGLWVRRLRNFVQQQAAGGHGSIRLMPGLLYLVEAKTGKLTLARDLDIVGTPLDLMNSIMRAGTDLKAQNLLYGVPISAVVPSLLLSDAELQRAETKPEKAPILPPP